MYRCRQCKAPLYTALLRKDRFDGEIYKICPRCKAPAEEPEERCCLCGGELFAGDRAYEIEDKVYCRDCVAEVTV